MSYDELMQAVVDKADNEVAHILKITERKLEDIDHRNEKNFRELMVKIEDRAEKDLEKARKTIIYMASAIIALVVTALVMFVNYEVRSLYDSIGDLKDRIGIAEEDFGMVREDLDQQLTDVQIKSEELSQTIDAALRENQSAVAGLMTTRSQFAESLSEVDKAQAELQTMSSSLESVIESAEIAEWEEIMQLEGKVE